MKEIDQPEEAQRLNEFVRGRVLTAVEFNKTAPDAIVLLFEDGAEVELSTLGAVEIERLDQPALPTMRRNTDLSRDEAELLDDLLQADGSDRARGIAEDLWRIWGITPWEQRP